MEVRFTVIGELVGSVWLLAEKPFVKVVLKVLTDSAIVALVWLEVVSFTMVSVSESHLGSLAVASMVFRTGESASVTFISLLLRCV